MRYQIELTRIEPHHTAVIRDRVKLKEIARFVPAACGEVWSFIRAQGLPVPGRNLALYLDAKGMVECGVEVSASFIGSGRIVCSHTPGGLVATTPHFGPYSFLPDAHSAIRRWCSDHGVLITGVAWEIYAHWQQDWNRDPAKILTDVYYLIRTEEGF